MAKIIGPSSIIVDLTAFTSHLPVEGETVKGEKLRMSAGGKGSNQMTAASRLGSEVIIIGKLGKDSLSEIIKSHYNADNISMEYVEQSEKYSTDTALIEIDVKSGQNRIIVMTGSSGQVDDKQVLAAEKEFKDADLVLCQYETGVSSIIEAKKLAKKYNIPFVCNPAPFMEMPKEFYEGIDYITPNETEAEYITGIKTDSIENVKLAAKKLLSMGIKNAVITLGKRGSYFTDGKREIIIDSLPVKAVETTGAGDAFNGGFITAIAEGKSVDDAMRFATCVASISVTRLGAASSMPYRKEVEELYLKTYGKKF